MRIPLFLSGLLFCTAAFGQGNTTADYYQYQRDQQFKQYMENVSSKGMAGPANTNFNYSIDKQAIQNMVDMWEKRSGRKTTAEKEAERAALRQKWATEYQRSLAYDAFDDNRYMTYQKMRDFYADIYKSAGFSVPESNMLAYKRIMEKRATYNDSYGVLVFVDYPAVDIAFSAKKAFEEIKQTASFEELIPLIYDFSFTGYSAVKALEYLETRFPDKKAIINTLKPLYGISFWQIKDEKFQVQSTTSPGKTDYYFSFTKVEGRELRSEMADYAYKWMEENPEGFVSLFENGNYAHDAILDVVQSKKQWQELSRFMVNAALHGRFNIAQKGQMMERYRAILYDVKTRKGREEEARQVPKMFSWQDFEAIKNRYKVPGVKAMELLGVVCRRDGELGYSFGPSLWLDPAYHEEVKRYAENGETDAKFLYAVNRVDVGSKTEKSEAYTLLRQLLEEGYQYVPDVVYQKDIYKELGFGKKDKGEYEALKKKCEKNESKAVVNSIHFELNKQGTLLFDSWSTAKDKYKWLALETAETDANVHRYVKDDQLYFTAKSDYYTWGVTNLNQTKTNNFIYEASIKLDNSYSTTQGEVGLEIELEEKQGVTPTKLLFMVRPGISRFFVGSFNPNGTKWTAFTSPHEDGGWVRSAHVQQKYIPFPEYKLSVRKEGDTYHFYIDQAYVFSHNIKESEAKFAGIGVVQKGKCKGQMSSIRFVSDVSD